jgi:hypothetical protein
MQWGIGRIPGLRNSLISQYSKDFVTLTFKHSLHQHVLRRHTSLYKLSDSIRVLYTFFLAWLE